MHVTSGHALTNWGHWSWWTAHVWIRGEITMTAHTKVVKHGKRRKKELVLSVSGSHCRLGMCSVSIPDNAVSRWCTYSLHLSAVHWTICQCQQTNNCIYSDKYVAHQCRSSSLSNIHAVFSHVIKVVLSLKHNRIQSVCHHCTKSITTK